MSAGDLIKRGNQLKRRWVAIEGAIALFGSEALANNYGSSVLGAALW